MNPAESKSDGADARQDDADNAAVRPRFSIVVPCFNEQDNVQALIDEIKAVIGNSLNYEIIMIDDCSTDDTAAQLQAAKRATFPVVRVATHRNNAGQSAAICTGVEVARGDWIVTLDGDGQNDPADIPRLIGALDEQNTDRSQPIICGHRVNRQDNWVRKFSSRIANNVRSRLLNDSTLDTGCGLKIINRAAFLRFPRFDHMHRFLPALNQRDGGYVVSVSVNHRPRIAGTSKYGIQNRLWVGISDLVGVMWLRRRMFKSTDYEEN